MTAGRVLSRLLLLAALATAAVLARPYAERAVRLVRLVTSDPPARLPMPLETVGPEAIADTWQAARGGDRTHQGVDVFAPRGTPVRSTTEGMIVNVGENRLGGRTVMVLGPAGQRHYYAHLDRYGDYHEGDWVEPGAVIGYVGSTGNASPAAPHLHYGIYDKGNSIDPLPLLRSHERAEDEARQSSGLWQTASRLWPSGSRTKAP